MQQDSGRGAITTKNVFLIQNQKLAWGQITACKHANGKDWWVLVPKRSSTYYYRFLVTQQGVSSPDSISVSWAIPSVDSGQGVFSPDGTKYARYTWGIDSRLLVCDFDRCTGKLSNPKEVPIGDTGGGGGGSCVFSPNSRYIYTTDLLHIHQFDTEASDITASGTLIMTYDGFADPGSASFNYRILGNDNRIYYACGGSSRYIHCIHYPDSAGLSCQAVQRAIYLPTANMRSLPNYPNYNLGAMSPTACDSIISITKQEEVIPQFSIYPNPATNQINLRLSDSPKTDLHINVYNAWGQLVESTTWKADINKMTVDTQNYVNGMYFITLLQDGNIIHQGKVIISN